MIGNGQVRFGEGWLEKGLDTTTRYLVSHLLYRRDGFVRIMQHAMKERLGHDAEEVTKVLTSHKIPRHLIKDALEIARRQGAFTIFAVVDALTQLTQKVTYAGDRTELDARIGKLMNLALAV